MCQDKKLPIRKNLPHEVPSWVGIGACHFITICAFPKGRNQLAIPAVADAIADSFAFNMRRNAWWANLLLTMPDHVHALVTFAPEPGIERSISAWKHFVSRKCGIVWQRDFFEHRVRNVENHEEKAFYIRMNPVRYGLVVQPEQWPFVWSAEELLVRPIG